MNLDQVKIGLAAGHSFKRYPMPGTTERLYDYQPNEGGTAIKKLESIVSEFLGGGSVASSSRVRLNYLEDSDDWELDN